MATQLTPAQLAVLAYAHQHTEGKIVWYPDNIKGGARKKVIDGLFNRALITPLGGDWFVAAEGYDALGVARPASITLSKLDAVIVSAEAALQLTDLTIDSEIEAAVTAIEASTKVQIQTPRIRDNSKQAQVINMLKRPEGATIAQIVEATGWQAHTVRGTFAGAFKKKLGLKITSSKEPGGERIYSIAD